MRLRPFILMILAVCAAACEDNNEDEYLSKDPVTQQRSTKRGVAFNYQLDDDISTLSEGIAWSYNWGIAQSSEYDSLMVECDLDYCPMAWNGIDEDKLRDYVSRNPQCEYLLAYNEPNLTDQANMTPQQAAEKWPEIKSIADELGLKIISPAMNYGTLENYSDPIVWLDEFFELVPISNIEGIAIHCYMPSAGLVKSYIERFKKYNKPIWLTEFCAWDGLSENSFDAEGQQKYMSDIVNYLESDPDVFRYAWFIPRASGSEENFPYMFLLKNSATSELTELGEIYMQMSTLDTDIYYVEQQQIEAEHYSAISIADGVGTENWVNGPRVRITSESPNESLELYNFLSGQWVEYQLLAEAEKEYTLEIRYANIVDAYFDIYVDGDLQISTTLLKTSKEYIWNTAEVPLKLTAGNHTIRLSLTEGSVCMNWLRFE